MGQKSAGAPSAERSAGHARQRKSQPRSQIKRQRILEAATRHFAEHDYQSTRVEDIAKRLGISKGSVFQHFGSKEGLFLECYKNTVGRMANYLDAPPEIVEQGFFATLRYWLESAESRIRDDWTTFRIAIIGDYGTSLSIRREINGFLEAKDPYGVDRFIRMGIERGEVRDDIDPALLGTALHWMFVRFEDACAAEELDPGIIRRSNGSGASNRAACSQYLELMRSALARR